MINYKCDVKKVTFIKKVISMREFLEKTLRQNVIMTENKDVYKKLPLAYRGRYAIFTVLLSEGDTTITLLCERVNSTAQFCKLLKEIYCYMIT